MSFWNLNDGQNAQQSGGEFQMGGGNIEPIPENTNVLAIAEEAKNSEYNGSSYINVKWRVSQPAEFANRVIFQKIHAYDPDSAKADKAKRMLAAVAANSGGGLFNTMAQKNEMYPSDESLTQICNRPMVLKLGVWKIYEKNSDGSDNKSKIENQGNWVQAVSPRKQQTTAGAPAAGFSHQAPAQPAPATADFDSDIPFAPIGLSSRSLLNCI